MENAGQRTIASELVEQTADYLIQLRRFEGRPGSRPVACPGAGVIFVEENGDGAGVRLRKGRA